MKRIGNIYSRIYDMDNIRTAHSNARKGKTHYKEVRMVDANPEYYFRKIEEMLRDKMYVTSMYRVFTRQDRGKTREIYRLPYFPDRIVHHCIMQVLEPIWTKVFIADTYSSIKKRGIHCGVRRLKEALEDKELTRYCLKFDIRKFYPSIDHDNLKQIIRRKIKDRDMLSLLDDIIDSAPGIPIGNYISQHLANLYLTYFDHWMKETVQCRYYYRYCDDVVILDKSKIHLHQVFVRARQYLTSELKLSIKDNWQIFPVASRGIDFLGYRFFHGYTLLRKSIAAHFIRKLRRIKRQWRSMADSAIINGVMSYYGWCVWANSYNFLHKHVNERIRKIVAYVAVRCHRKNPLIKVFSTRTGYQGNYRLEGHTWNLAQASR